MKKINLIITIIFIVQGCTQNVTTTESANKKIGFEMEEGNKVSIYGGSQDGVAIMDDEMAIEQLIDREVFVGGKESKRAREQESKREREKERQREREKKRKGERKNGRQRERDTERNRERENERT